MNETLTKTPRTTDAEPADSRTRVSLREIRETAFRALSAAGASHGEASSAARMVLDAELQDCTGIEELIRDLERGSWARGGIDVIESDGRSPTRLGVAATNRLLQHGPLGVDLAAAELDSAGVFLPGEFHVVQLLDAFLLEVAGARTCSIGVVALVPGTTSHVRIARADGALGFGTLRDNPPIANVVGGEHGLWFVAPVPESWQAADLTWITSSRRADVRADAAREGRLIEATRWSHAYGAARRYLVK